LVITISPRSPSTAICADSESSAEVYLTQSNGSGC
jgi:hypothetical protein